MRRELALRCEQTQSGISAPYTGSSFVASGQISIPDRVKGAVGSA
jgi:hypothetical protein